MLNYSYALLQEEVEKAINLNGLDPYCGFLHWDKKGRSSLVFDVMEEFRQQVDKTVLSIINRKQVTKEDFIYEEGKVLIEKSTKKILISSIMDKINKKMKYNNERISYAKLIEKQVKKIVDFLVNNEKYTPFYLRW